MLRSPATLGAPSTMPPDPRYGRQETEGRAPGIAKGSTPWTGTLGEPFIPRYAACSPVAPAGDVPVSGSPPTLLLLRAARSRATNEFGATAMPYGSRQSTGCFG